MNKRLMEYLKVKNHSVAFLRLISAEIYEYDQELANRFLILAEKKREYEELLAMLISGLDNSSIALKEILSKAYYDYDVYNELDFSSEKEELSYLLDIINDEENKVNNGISLMNSYLKNRNIIM